jgi:hypothetical protein
MTRRSAWAWLPLAASSLATTGAAVEAPSALEIVDRLEAPAQAPNGVRIDELSGLAWDADEELLYAVSDDGVLFHFRIRLAGNSLAEIEPVSAVRLVTAAGAPSARPNAEGLAAINGDNGRRSDTELLIALEDGPTIARFTALGEHLGDVALPGGLSDASVYQEENERLEAIAVHPRHGILTAPEAPLSGQPKDVHTLHAADGTTWSFRAFQPARSNIKAVESLPDGNLLVLERTRAQKGAPPIARLRYLDLAACTDGRVCSPVELSASSGAMLEDNFEGLAHLSGNLFLMVTDRKGKEPEPTAFLLFTLGAP